MRTPLRSALRTFPYTQTSTLVPTALGSEAHDPMQLKIIRGFCELLCELTAQLVGVRLGRTSQEL